MKLHASVTVTRHIKQRPVTHTVGSCQVAAADEQNNTIVTKQQQHLETRKRSHEEVPNTAGTASGKRRAGRDGNKWELAALLGIWLLWLTDGCPHCCVRPSVSHWCRLEQMMSEVCSPVLLIFEILVL